jgi:MFS family permease
MLSDAQRTRRTYVHELWRAGTAGILETAGSTFLLAIAVKHFAAGGVAKAIVAGSGSLGLLLSPLIVSLVTARRWPTSQAAARVLALGGTSFLLATILPGLGAYVLFSVIGMTASACIIPLLTHMYQENYPTHQRGRLFSHTVMIRIAMAALFSKLAGDAMDGHEDRYRWLLLIFAGALGFASVCLARCPTTPIPHDGGAHPLRALRFVRDDALFRRTLICWMLMGFANLMMLPLRVEYLANPQYNQAVSLATIALLTGVIPNLARLVLSPVWGYLFDHMNFFTLRIILNVGFAVGILTFFTSNTMTGLVLGAIVFGISNAGGDVAWSLWVTKFAPAGRVADYMAVHTFLTGVRGVAAPAAAFYAVGHLSPAVLATICCGMILAASALLIPELRQVRGRRSVPPVVEEVSE